MTIDKDHTPSHGIAIIFRFAEDPGEEFNEDGPEIASGECVRCHLTIDLDDLYAHRCEVPAA